ncbi:MAG: HD domain-containing protein [Methanobacteriota archaeon]|nr:MAG: HD domain-containing protein [Euryarchaeota archaeon]
MTVEQETLEVIRDYAIHNDWYVAFEGKSKGNQHLNRVHKIVKHLGEQEGARLDICIAGGWLHDLGLVEGNRGHCFSGGRLAREYLQTLGLDAEDIGLIVHCIEAHDGEILAETLEAKIVHDSDTIDKMGPFGFVRHAWKISLVEDISGEQLLDTVAEHIADRKSKLYLGTSIKIVEDLHQALEAFVMNRDTAKEVVEKIVHCASKGIPSEDTAHILMNDPALNEDFKDTIDSQMSISYLE